MNDVRLDPEQVPARAEFLPLGEDAPGRRILRQAGARRRAGGPHQGRRDPDAPPLRIDAGSFGRLVHVRQHSICPRRDSRIA
ncbi:MAG: hypothetical protein OXH52_17080 [Gammaproteobacteria bacterium]|nr:hypothetical protein [Gammaproteobacteria bacterium]